MAPRVRSVSQASLPLLLLLINAAVITGEQAPAVNAVQSVLPPEVPAHPAAPQPPPPPPPQQQQYQPPPVQQPHMPQPPALPALPFQSPLLLPSLQPPAPPPPQQPPSQSSASPRRDVMCTCGVFLSGQFTRGSNDPPRGNPAMLHEDVDSFPNTPFGLKQCTNRCLDIVVKHLPNSPAILCGSIDRDCHKERAYLFVKNGEDRWVNTNLSAGREYCCKDGVPYRCPIIS